MKSIEAKNRSISSEKKNNSPKSNVSSDKDRLISSFIVRMGVITGRILNPTVEEPVWRESLSKYPIWKLERLNSEYRGALNHAVFAALDAMREEPESAREALGYNSKQITNYSDPEKGKYFLRTIQDLMLLGLKKENFEQALYWLMKLKFPDWEG